jgi:hypothetical protein
LNAQIATRNPKFFDNWYTGAFVGLNTPLSFNQMFPLNTTLGLKVGKEITKVYGVELESFVSLNDHISGHTNGHINTLNSRLSSVEAYIGNMTAITSQEITALFAVPSSGD